jgi:hypothetical protein
VTIKADNYFAMIPEWVLDADISAQAVRLYCVLRRYADQGGRCYPSRKRIAERMRVSPATVDRAVQELVDLGAIRVRQRYNPDTREHTSNEYLVLSNLPLGLLADDETSSAGDETGLLAGDELTRANMNESQELEHSAAHANVSASDAPRLSFERWWHAYPRKVGKAAALRRWRSLSPADRERALDAVHDHALRWSRERTEARFIPHPATWLSQGRWDDDLDTEARHEPSMPSAVRHAAELLARARSTMSEQASYERELESTYEEEWL